MIAEGLGVHCYTLVYTALVIQKLSFTDDTDIVGLVNRGFECVT